MPNIESLKGGKKDIPLSNTSQLTRTLPPMTAPTVTKSPPKV